MRNSKKGREILANSRDLFEYVELHLDTNVTKHAKRDILARGMSKSALLKEDMAHYRREKQKGTEDGIGIS